MLWSSLDTAKTKNSQPNPIPFSKAGTSAELGVVSLLSTVLHKAAIKVVDCSDFCGGFLPKKIKQQKNPPENPPPEHKKSARTPPPYNHQPDQKIRRKICHQIRSSNLQPHCGFCD